MRGKLKQKVEEKNMEKYGGLGQDMKLETYLHGSQEYARKLKLQFRAGTLTCQAEKIGMSAF